MCTKITACAFICGISFTTGQAAAAQPAEQLDQLQQIIEQQQLQLEVQRQQIRVLEQKMLRFERTSETLEHAVSETLPNTDHIDTGTERAPTRHVQERLDTNPGFASRPKVMTKPERYKVSVGANLNRQVTVGADGNKTKAYFVDSSNIPTHVFLKGSANVNDDLTLGTRVEYALQDNATIAVSQENERAGFRASGRFFEVTADSKSWGKASFGKGFASSFGIIEIDFSGTYYANLLSVGNSAGGLRFYSGDSNAYTNFSVGSAFLDQESLSLINRVRYDAPAWNGIQFSGTTGEDQYADGAVRFKRSLDGFDFMSIATYQDNPNGALSDWRFAGGAGILHRSTGYNLTIAGSRAKAKTDGRKSEGFIVRAGRRHKWFDIGETKTTIDYTRSENITTQGDVATSYGLFLVQDIDQFGLQLYTGYRKYDLDRDDIRLDDIGIVTFGMAINISVDVSPDP